MSQDADEVAARERGVALKAISDLRTLLERLPEGDPNYLEVIARQHMMAAEGLNYGLEPETVQSVGAFSEFEMRKIRGYAREFQQDDAEVAAEEAARHAETARD